MTDEELAKEYAHNHVHYEVAMREDGTQYAKEVSDVTIKEAHLAGIKVGKQQNWHDLTKDPNDLPPVDPMYPQCSIHVFNSARTSMYYCFKIKEWISDISYNVINPIAWYDMPDYEWEK